MSENPCVCCDRPTPDGYACASCSDTARAQLAEIADMAVAARDVAYGQARRGGDGGASGKPGSRSPGNDDALDALNEIQGTLTTWARHISEERGVPWRFDGEPDPIVDAVQWLDEHVEWLRHRAEVDEAYRDFEACARRIRGVVDGPAPKRYLGPCGAWRDHAAICEGGDDPSCDCPEICEGDVYGPAGGSKGTCRTCGDQVDQDERRAWLDDQVRGQAFRAAHIADAYGISADTIRTWAARGKLTEHGRDRDGYPIYLVEHVLDLAAQAAARRAENEARRARKGVAA